MRTIKQFLALVLTVFLIRMYQINAIENIEFADRETRYQIIADNILIDKQGTYLVFDDIDDLSAFLNQGALDTPLHAPCLPGDPGYPHCNSNPVVQITSVYLHTYYSGWISGSSYLLDAWTYGGPAGASMSIGYGKSTTISFEGLSLGVSTNQAHTFNVPPNKSGNANIRAKYKVDVYRTIYILKDGTRVPGSNFKKYTQVDIEVYPVFR